MREAPTTPEGLRQYDSMNPCEAARRSWHEPGQHPHYHEKMKDEVRARMPLLARALDRLGQV